jgi:hypothetical protein
LKILSELTDIILEHNPYVLCFKTHKEKVEEELAAAQAANRPERIVRMMLMRNDTVPQDNVDRYRPNRYNHPSIGEIAAIFELNDKGTVPKNINVISHLIIIFMKYLLIINILKFYFQALCLFSKQLQSDNKHT